MTARTLLLSCLAAILGCGASHGARDGGPRDDAGRPLDAASADASAAGDASGDAGADASVAPPTSCTGELLSSAGSGCFCQGPFARSGDLAYRVSYEIEVHGVSRDTVAAIVATPQMHHGSEGAVAVARGHLFVGGWGLEIFDLSVPMEPRSVWSVPLEGTVTDLFVQRATMWIGLDGRDESTSLVAYDVSATTAPRELISFPLSGVPGSVLLYEPERIVVLEARRFGETGPDTAAIVDITRPSAPELVTRIPLEGRGILRRRGAIEGDSFFVVGSEPTLQVVDLVAGEVVATLDAPEGGSSAGISISVSDGLAFVGSSGIHIADVSLPSAPRWIGSLPTAGDPFYSRRDGDRLLVSNGNTLDLYSLDCR